jgi:CheY-like chemotaxis protein
MKNNVVLFVEDNKRDEMLTLRAFEKSSFATEIVVAHNGVEALDYLFGTGEYTGRDTTILPQMILLDLKMPKMDGIQVIKRLRSDKRTRALPIVVFTSSSEQEDIIRSYELGANSYVRKPVDFGEFAEATRQLGQYWLLLNETVPNT